MDDDTAEICTQYPPFGLPPVFDPAWRTETVTALAKGIEADAAFDRMPILADALEEAGCDDPAVLGHCRDRCDHHPWCWVLNAVFDRPAEPVPLFPQPTPIIVPQPSPPPPTPRGGGGRSSSGLPAIVGVFVVLNLFRLCAGGLPSNTSNSPTPLPPKFSPPLMPTEGQRVRTPATNREFEKWVRQWEWNRTPATGATPDGVVIPAATVPTGR